MKNMFLFVAVVLNGAMLSCSPLHQTLLKTNLVKPKEL